MNRIISRIFIKDEEAVMKKTYLWTVLSGLAYSASTFLMLLVTTNLMGAYAGGIFSIALTIGQQLVTVGYFNVRTFQVSDVKGQFAFRDYFTSRMLTTGVMFAAGIIVFLPTFLNFIFLSEMIIAGVTGGGVKG